MRGLRMMVWVGGFVPAALLGYRAYTGSLGANPIAEITHATGEWTLRFLLITLAITPLRKIPGASNLIRVRRSLGLFAFLYGVLHFITYLWLDQFFDLAEILRDVAKRPFITVGFLAFVLLIPLAITSTDGMIRRLGGKRWRRLHQMIYLSTAAGVVHFYWGVKADHRLPLIYGALLLGLLGVRVILWQIRKPKVPVSRLT